MLIRVINDEKIKVHQVSHLLLYFLLVLTHHTYIDREKHKKKKNKGSTILIQL